MVVLILNYAFSPNILERELLLPALALRTTIRRQSGTDCMGGLCHYIVACVHLGNGTCRKTATIVALLLTSGLAKYEVGLHGNLLIFV